MCMLVKNKKLLFAHIRACVLERESEKEAEGQIETERACVVRVNVLYISKCYVSV